MPSGQIAGNSSQFGRRDFLRLGVLSLGALRVRPVDRGPPAGFPQADRLRRSKVGKMDASVKPDGSTSPIGVLYEDNVFAWLREVVGSMPGRINQRFVETPYGFVWGYVQPVWNLPNVPLAKLPTTSLDQGMWVELTVPQADLTPDNSLARAPWLQYVASINLPPRFCFSQIVWIDAIRTDPSGPVSHRLNEKYGSGDSFWAPAEAFRPLTAQDTSPINPDIGDKHILVRISDQPLSCFEGNTEVHFAKISSGALYDAWGNRVDAQETPIGEFRPGEKPSPCP